MEKKIIFTIVMAAYNSEKVIGQALKSIREQIFDQTQVEILVVDGGSTDSTRDIALEYNACILENPYKLPEPAKVIGFKQAKGKYVCIMDTDEVICKHTSLKERYEFMQAHQDVKCYRIGLKTPPKSQACCYYINAVGDPFTCFIYQTFKGGMENLICKHAIDKMDGYVGKFEKDDIKPIGDSCTLFDREYVFEHYEEELRESTTAMVFEKIIDDTGLVGYIESDFHWHYSKSSFPVFFNKLKFRVVNNVHNMEGSGYAKKANSNKKLNRRKYLYPFYSISVVCPIFDAIRMAINYRHPVFLLHPIFALYVLVEIVIQMTKKIMGKKTVVKKYG